MQVPQITYKRIVNVIDPKANLQKVQVYLNGQALPITVEKTDRGYCVRATLIDESRFSTMVDTKEGATATARGLVFDRILAKMAELTPEEVKPEVKEEEVKEETTEPKTRVEWRFKRGKYRIYTPGSNRQLFDFEGGLIHLHNWAKKHPEYEIINKLPVIKPVKK